MRKIERTIAPSDNTRVVVRKEFVSIPLNREQKQNLKIYGSWHRPEVKQTELDQGKKLSPGERVIRDKKSAKQTDLEEYQKRKEKEAKDLETTRTATNEPINTTAEFILDPKTMKLIINPNVKMGLENVYPEFQLLTAGVGYLGSKAMSIAGKIARTMVHGAGQGAMANMSNLSGSEQSASGLAQDVVGGAVVGGLLKGV